MSDDDKDIKDLIPDIHEMLYKGSDKINEDYLDAFLADVKSTIIEYVEERQKVDEEKPSLRISKIGVGLRKAWFEHNHDWDSIREKGSSEVGPQIMRFLQGHLNEALLIFLARQAGHTVTHEQHEVDLDGVEGHLDAVIDGHLVDIKTASMFAFPKFAGDGILNGEDPFGYKAQLSGYRQGLLEQGVDLKSSSYFWAYNKSNSEMVLTEIPKFDMIDARGKIQSLRDTIEKESPDDIPYCYEPVAKGKSGNKVLNPNCGFCMFKERCWKDANNGRGLRKFRYAKGIEYFTEVKEEPTVEEVE